MYHYENEENKQKEKSTTKEEGRNKYSKNILRGQEWKHKICLLILCVPNTDEFYRLYKTRLSYQKNQILVFLRRKLKDVKIDLLYKIFTSVSLSLTPLFLVAKALLSQLKKVVSEEKL